MNEEGGVDGEEAHWEINIDRVNTTGATWLGSTIGCAQCHNHKYDPFSQKEYYQLFAFFNNGDETTADVPLPADAVAKYEREKAENDRKLKALEESLEAKKPSLAAGLPKWEEEVRSKLAAEDAEAFKTHPLEIVSAKPSAEVKFQRMDDGSLLAGGAEPVVDTYALTVKSTQKEITGFRLEVIADKALPSKGPGRAPNGNFVLSEFRVEADGKKVALADAEADFAQDGFPAKNALDAKGNTGWAVSPQMGKNHHATFRTKAPLRLEPGRTFTVTLDQQYGEKHTIGRFRLLAITGTRPPFDLPADVKKALAVEPAKRSAAETRRLVDQYAAVAPETTKIVQQIQIAKDLGPKPPIMSARILRQRVQDPRKTFIFRRGEFLQPTTEVRPGTLASMHPLRPRGSVPDRLDPAGT